MRQQCGGRQTPPFMKGVPLMKQKRIVTIQDISCFGKCSLTVALPVLSAMGLECAIVPTAVLSTHTGGFTGYTFCDLTGEISKISDHWSALGLSFDCIYTGYLGSAEQIALMEDFFDRFGSKDNIIFVDPVMADNGVLYGGFPEDFPKGMAKLCSKADVIVPNLTEAAFMLGEEFHRPCTYDEEYIKGLLKRLCGLGCRTAVVTGVCYEPSMQGAVAYDSEKDEYIEYFSENIPVSYHGTGDVFSSSLAGALTLGRPMKEALRIAVDYTVGCIKETIGDEEHFYGVKFENRIPDLLRSLGK